MREKVCQTVFFLNAKIKIVTTFVALLTFTMEFISNNEFVYNAHLYGDI